MPPYPPFSIENEDRMTFQFTLPRRQVISPWPSNASLESNASDCWLKQTQSPYQGSFTGLRGAEYQRAQLATNYTPLLLANGLDGLNTLPPSARTSSGSVIAQSGKVFETAPDFHWLRAKLKLDLTNAKEIR